MKIIEAEFSGYIRIALTGANYFYFKPTEITQIFLGTNGSGKSSLLEEFFPFPAATSDFSSDGFKRVRYDHNNTTYEVKSTFSPTFHSFKILKDDEWVELNESGKQTIQYELAQQHFGLTPEIRDYLMGIKLFTELRPMERREIFTKMSDADYTFGLKLYNEARTKARDITGAIKFIKERISRESIKLISDEEYQQLNAQQKLLHKELDRLYHERDNQLQSATSYVDKAHDDITRITQLTERIFSMDVRLPTEIKVTKREDVEAKINTLDKERYALSEVLSSKTKQFNQLVKEKNLLSQTGGEGIHGVKKRLDGHAAALREATDRLSRPWDFQEPRVAYNAFTSLLEELTDIFTRLPNNESKYFSNHVLNEKRRSRDELVAKENRLVKLDKELFYEISHQESHQHKPATVCPKCEYSWVIGFNETHLKQLKKKQADYGKELTDLRNQLKTLDGEIATILEFIDTYLRYTKIRQAYPTLNPLWDALDQDDLSFTLPKSVLVIIHQLQKDFSVLLDIDNIKREIHKDELLLNALKESDLQNVEKVSSTMEALELELGQLTAKMDQKQHEINYLTRFLKDVNSLVTYDAELRETLISAKQTRETLLKAYYNDYVNEAIRIVQSQLAQVEQRFTFAQTQKGVIDELTTSLENQSLLLETYKTITKELSPTEGLIAEGLNGFITAFVRQMNHFLASSWSYEMEVLPCSVEKENSIDLDYRFPLRLKNRAKALQDVRLGSKGIKSIINLAFRIVMIKYLRLVDIPLFLDEFGDGLDDHHRVSSTHAITTASEQMGFRQVFIISHYIETYGSIANSEICVLDNTNLAIEAEHNKHVVLR